MPFAYDAGYEACPCFWGKEPGSLVSLLERHVRSFAGAEVLDLGCGEGKNAAFLAGKGASVRAIDCSPYALRNARREWGDQTSIRWELADTRHLTPDPDSVDMVIAYGLFHCYDNIEDVQRSIHAFKRATRSGGFNVLCAFNDRAQDLRTAHPEFSPLLLPHSWYINAYKDWVLVSGSDSDLREVHPHNGIEHVHSMTRLLAAKPR